MIHDSGFINSSPEETQKFAADFARGVVSDFGRGEERREGAVVVALDGELGAGKTTFVQGFAIGLGVKDRVVSPTFVFVRRFPISCEGFRDFFHVDAYRVEGAGEPVGLGLEEVFSPSLILWSLSGL